MQTVISGIRVDWAKEIQWHISPFLLGRLCSSAFESPECLQKALKPIAGVFRIMDLPIELRQLVWSYDLPSWEWMVFPYASADDANLDRFDGSALLQVSKDIRKEVASFSELGLTMNGYGDEEELQSYIKSLQRRLNAMESAHAVHAINHLSRLCFTLITADNTRFKFNLVSNSRNDLILTTCRRQRDLEQWKALDAETLAEAQSNVQKLNSHKEPSTYRGLRLLQAIIACQSIWQRLLDENPAHDTDDSDIDDHHDYNHEKYFDDSEGCW
jgi:hypothetical protein